jgi:hypothetical protein
VPRFALPSSAVNVEFHYYIVYYLARKAGFADDDAWLVAYSSQHVDASLVSYTVRTPGGEYRTAVTQDYGWWDESFPRTVYVPFHFFPGEPGHPGARRADGSTNPLNTTPGSANVKALLVAALETRDPYRVGIGLHTYADSWAHQSFSGVLEEWNAVDPGLPIPAIGHAQALTSPDRLSLVWEDPRLVGPAGTVRNWERHLAAARMVYKYLATFTGRGFDDADLVLGDLAGLLSPQDPRRSGEERILDLIIAMDLRKYERHAWLEQAVLADPGLTGRSESEQSGYDRLTWLRDAALHRTSLARKKPVEAREGFASSHLHRWNEAARAHLAAAWRILPVAISDLVTRKTAAGR